MNNFFKKNIGTFWEKESFSFLDASIDNFFVKNSELSKLEDNKNISFEDDMMHNIYPVPENQAICFYRMSVLEKFDGDEEAGYSKPPVEVVGLVKDFLKKIYDVMPNLESPVISPAPDGEIIISWRKNKGYFLCCFDEESNDFEWIFNYSKMINGKEDSKDGIIQKNISLLVDLFFNPEGLFAVNSKSKNTTNPSSFFSMHFINHVESIFDNSVKNEYDKETINGGSLSWRN